MRARAARRVVSLSDLGPDFGRLLPAPPLLGTGYLLTVDPIDRITACSEVPFGILTALIGAPSFLWLLASGQREWT